MGGGRAHHGGFENAGKRRPVQQARSGEVTEQRMRMPQGTATGAALAVPSQNPRPPCCMHHLAQVVQAVDGVPNLVRRHQIDNAAQTKILCRLWVSRRGLAGAFQPWSDSSYRRQRLQRTARCVTCTAHLSSALMASAREGSPTTCKHEQTGAGKWARCNCCRV